MVVSNIEVACPFVYSAARFAKKSRASVVDSARHTQLLIKWT